MTVDAFLQAAACNLVAENESKLKDFQAELEEVERRKLQIKAKLDATHSAIKRLFKFKPRVGAHFQAPVEASRRSRS